MNPEPRMIPGMRDAGPPHSRLLCIPGDWLCRYPADDGHSIHAPYVENEYLIADPARPTTA